jgi:hypothetical protein
MSTLTPNMPQELLRTFTADYMLGLHSYDGNQPFLIFQVDSSQQAYSGMLKWEPRLQSDLSPLFTRAPRPETPQELASSTPATTTPEVVSTGFVDVVLENFDARAIRDQNGDILLLWTFLDPHTLIITTNQYTLREVLSRRASLPGSIE